MAVTKNDKELIIWEFDFVMQEKQESMLRDSPKNGKQVRKKNNNGCYTIAKGAVPLFRIKH